MTLTAVDLARRTVQRAQRVHIEEFAALPFEEFCARYLRIQDKAGQIVPLRLNRAQRDLVNALTGHDLVLKARQLGMSTAIQAHLFWKQMRGYARTSTLCHEDDLTATLRRMADRFYDNLSGSVQPARKYANAKVTTYPTLFSESSIATVGGLAGTRKGRGMSVTHIHGSEVAFWPDAQAVMGAALQAGNPEIILESTPNGATGWFYERCMEALDGDGPWRLHFFPWWYDDGYRLPVPEGETLIYTGEECALADKYGLTAEQICWRRAKQRELHEMFWQEYPENPLSCFLASGNSFFGDVAHCFVAERLDGPQDGHRYVGGLDFGQAHDWTVLIILDANERCMVDMLRINQQSWADIRAAVEARAKFWGATVIAEDNSIGSVNSEALRLKSVDLVSFETTKDSKPPLIQGLRWALHEGGLKLLDDPVLRHELRAFISRQLPSGAWQYQAQEGSHDDTVIALALAWYGTQYGGLGISFV